MAFHQRRKKDSELADGTRKWNSGAGIIMEIKPQREVGHHDKGQQDLQRPELEMRAYLFTVALWT